MLGSDPEPAALALALTLTPRAFTVTTHRSRVIAPRKLQVTVWGLRLSPQSRQAGDGFARHNATIILSSPKGHF